MKDYQVYIFDWDGTLAQTMEVWIAAVGEQLRLHQIEFNDYQIAHGFVGRLRPGIEEHGIRGQVADSLVEAVVASGKQKMPDVTLYPMAREVLRHLKRRGKKLVLLTTSRRGVFESTVARYKLTQMFDLLIGAEDFTKPKPDPDGITFALKKLQISKDRALMVGDSEKDLAAAQKVSVDSLLFYQPSHQSFYDLKYLKSYNPTYTIDSWQELIDGLRA